MNLIRSSSRFASKGGNPALRLFGFGPVVPDGFGVGYIIKDHGFSFSVSSKHRQTKRYVDKLALSLMDLLALLQPISNVSVHHQKVSGAVLDEQQHGYGDIYGESLSAPALPEVSQDSSTERSSSGQYFSHVQERSQSVSLLSLADLGVELLDENETSN